MLRLEKLKVFNFQRRLFSASLNSEVTVSNTPYQAAKLLNAFVESKTVDQPVYLTLKVNVDLSRESVRGISQFPHGIGRAPRIAVFCNDEDADEMIKEGADYAGITELFNNVSQGRVDFDRCLASPDVMPRVIKLAKVLGPRRLMPNQKSGTVSTNLKEAIRQSKSGATVEFRAETGGLIKVQIGNTAFSDVELLNNIKKFTRDVMLARPRGSASSESGEVASFQWPLPYVKKMRAQQRKGEFVSPAFLEGVHSTSTVATGSSKADFIVSGLLEAQESPPITIEGGALKPSSTGYFR